MSKKRGENKDVIEKVKIALEKIKESGKNNVKSGRGSAK